MPGLGLVRRHYQEQRQEPKLEQRLELSLLQQAAFLPYEKEFVEQMKALDNILKDLNEGVYDYADEFSDRVMKRIKKEKRTKPVRKLIEAYRTLVDNNEIYIEEISGVTVLAINSGNLYHDPTTLIQSIHKFLQQTQNDIEGIIKIGTKINSLEYGMSTFINDLLQHDKEIIDYAYNRIDKFVNEYKDHSNTYGLLSKRVLHDARTKFAISKGFDLIEETMNLFPYQDETYKQLNIKKLLTHKNLESIVTIYENTPLPLLAQLLKIDVNEETIKKIDEFAGSKKLRDSKDKKRSFISTITALSSRDNAKEILEDICNKATGVRQAKDILTYVSRNILMGTLAYKFNMQTGQEILDSLKMVKYKNPVINMLSEEATNQIDELLKSRSADPEVATINKLLEYAQLFKGDSNENQVNHSVAETIEEILVGEYTDNKYADNSLKSWRKNRDVPRLVGDIKSAKPKLDAIKIAGERLLEAYKQEYKQIPTRASIAELQRKKSELFRLLNGATKEKTGQRLKEINAQTDTLRLIEYIESANIEDLPNMYAYTLQMMHKETPNSIRLEYENIEEVLKSKQVEGLQRIIIRDTDEHDRIIEVGLRPLKTCQRYTEKTTYNHALPAYILDGNKRLIQVTTPTGQVMIRSLLKYLMTKELKETPVLFLETPYSNCNTKELYKAMVTEVVKKAYDMSKESHGKIAVAGLDTNIKKEIQMFSRVINTKYKKQQLTFIIPESRNTVEYADSFGGLIHATKKKITVGYLIVDHSQSSQKK